MFLDLKYNFYYVFDLIKKKVEKYLLVSCKSSCLGVEWGGYVDVFVIKFSFFVIN